MPSQSDPKEGAMSTLAGYTISGHLHEGAASSLASGLSGLSGTLLLSGHERASGAPVVIKVASAESPPPRDLARLRHEYLILRSLSIPGVVKALGLERYGNGLALILEGVRGQPLSTYLRAHRPDLITALRIAVRLSEILHALHACGVSHRDIKPHLIRPDRRRPRFRSAHRTRAPAATEARALRRGSIAPDPTARCRR